MALSKHSILIGQEVTGTSHGQRQHLLLDAQGTHNTITQSRKEEGLKNA